jgi:hypothetical protein
MTAAENRISLTLRKMFPERQIYIRSAGRVQFWTFGSSIQAVLAAMALVLLGFAAFATIVVIFKDRSIAARDERYERTRAVYESRILQLQTAYSDLRGALAQSERQFDAIVGGVRRKQDMIAGLYASEYADERRVGNSSADLPPALSGEAGFSPSYTFSQAGSPNDKSAGNRLPEQVDSRARLAGGGFLPGIMSRLVSTAMLLLSRDNPYAGTAAKRPNPALMALGRQARRVQLLDVAENTVLENTGQIFSRRIGELRDVIRHTGVDPDLTDILYHRHREIIALPPPDPVVAGLG